MNKWTFLNYSKGKLNAMETNRSTTNATSNDKPNKYRNSNYRLYYIVTLNVLTKWTEYGPEHINLQWPLLNIGYQIMATPNQIQVSIYQF